MNFKIFKQVAPKSIELKEFKFRWELNMEAFLIENPQLLETEEYSEVKIIRNQLPIKSGRKSKGSDGRIDLLANISNKYLSIIELKNSTINKNHLQQLEDYLSEFSKEKEKYIRKLKSEYNISGDELLGIIVGTDIEPDIILKLNKGYIFNKIPIIGITINRYYSSIDNKEVFVLAETYAPRKSEFIKISFDNWDEFEAYQETENKIHKRVLQMAKKLHDNSIKNFNLSTNNVSYVKGAFTLNVPMNKQKTVFVYFNMKKTKLRIYMTYESNIPNGGIQNPDSRYANSYFVDIENISDINEELMQKFQKSYEIIKNT